MKQKKDYKLREQVNICAVPHVMSCHEGLVTFVSESGFYGHTARLSFERRSGLWYLVQYEDTVTKSVPVAHIKRCHEILCERFGDEHKPCWLDQDKCFREEQ